MIADPQSTFLFYLDRCEDQPERRALEVRYATVREWARAADGMDAAAKQPDSAIAYVEAIVAVMTPFVVGRQNIPDGDLCDVLTAAEFGHIRDNLLDDMRARDTDRKKLRSPLPSAAADSASNAKPKADA